MKNFYINLENCYGIKKLETEFDFSSKTEKKTYAIYAPNGSMKSSLAKTFDDQANGRNSSDLVKTTSVNSSREIKINDGTDDLPKENIFVIHSYNEELGCTEKTSTLLVNNKLRKEYEAINSEIERHKEILLKELKKQSGSKKDLEKEISATFMKNESKFYDALIRLENEVSAEEKPLFADIPYDKIFDEKVLKFLQTKDFKTTIKDYIERFNELLDNSLYFKKNMFNYYNAEEIAKNLDTNKFFPAGHSLNLNATKIEDKKEISKKEDLTTLIAKEKDGISKDSKLKEKLEEIHTAIHKNVELREFEAYLTEHPDILPELGNIDEFKEKIWKAYLASHLDLYKILVDKYKDAQKEIKTIESEAGKEHTQWETVIDIFNNRFFVPFALVTKNKTSVALGREKIPNLEFEFKDGQNNRTDIEKEKLMKVLSEGEKRAFYLLNVIFEVETRKKEKQKTLFIIDDIADSFDYKNKYAIIQYLDDITNESYFYQIIMTHNFDFFRTIESRGIVGYKRCLLAFKNNTGITLKKAHGIKNVFVKDWKNGFFNKPMKRIACIPFLRNLIEYTRGDEDNEYKNLTSLLHWKKDSSDINQDDLDGYYKSIISGQNDKSSDFKGKVIGFILDNAEECLDMDCGINFENKIVLSIAIRLMAEKFMVEKINDDNFVSGIDSDQTSKLLKKFKNLYPDDENYTKILHRVLLMTPENIHLNSFMYEPILDMSDDHLKQLHRDVQGMVNSEANVPLDI